MDTGLKLINQMTLATVYLALQMLRSIRLTNRKIEIFKLTNQKMLQNAFVALSRPQPLSIYLYIYFIFLYNFQKLLNNILMRGINNTSFYSY